MTRQAVPHGDWPRAAEAIKGGGRARRASLRSQRNRAAMELAGKVAVLLLLVALVAADGECPLGREGP